MKNLNRKDYIVLLVAIAMGMPIVCVFNCNPETWYVNLFGMVYALWLVRKLSTTKLGKAFCARMERIEEKVFSM